MYVKFTPLSLSLFIYIYIYISIYDETVEIFLLYLYPFLAAECKIVEQVSL